MVTSGDALPDGELTSSRAARLAVLMPAYNAETSIGRAVECVLKSTIDCDLFIVDDGSKTPVQDVVAPHPRVRILRLACNSGIARARNVGLRAILAGPYEFVACLDADDICRSHRFATQISFMDAHPEAAVVGSWGRLIDEKTEEPLSILRTPITPSAVKRTMHSRMAVINTSSLIRTASLRAVGLYSEAYPAAEDYELFRRIGTRFAITNIPELLVDVRMFRNGTSLGRRHRQLFDRLLIQLKYFDPLVWLAWLGLVRTLLLLLFPTTLYLAAKSAGRRVRAITSSASKRTYLANAD